MVFGLLCGAVMLGALALGPTPLLRESPRTCPSEATQQALEDTVMADLAIREDNFGAAQAHIQRARARLEAAMAEMNRSGPSPDSRTESPEMASELRPRALNESGE